MQLAILNVLFLLFAVTAAAKYDINSNIVNSNVVKKIDIATQLVRINTKITAKNGGGLAVDTYLFAIEPQLSSQLSFISAYIAKSGDSQEPLEVKEVTVDQHNTKKLYAVDLSGHKILANSELAFVVETTFTHILKPFPSHILQSEKQFVKYLGNRHYYSAYKTDTQTILVVCASSNIDSFTKEKPYNINGATISYGPYENIDAFKETTLSIHYENNTPFLTVTHLMRVIEISHWGNIAVEETFDIFHSGAILKGSFSRHDYQRSQDGVSSIKSFKTLLPLSARDIYYRDEIGNISTSSLKETDAGLELELHPRFPLFGGWKSQHYIGYNVPSYQYLYNNGKNFALVMKLIDHVYDDQVIDSFELKIILPERSSDINLQTPYKVNRQGDGILKTYLDTIGRPVIHVSKNNVVEQHIQDFQLYYSFSKQLMLQEPLMVFGAFFFLFFTAIVYVRLDFSIAKDEATEAKLRLGGLLRQVVDLHERRSALYQSYDDAVNKFKTSKDSAAFKSNLKNIDGDHKNLTGQISSLQAKLKVESVDAFEKLNELQRLDTQVRSQITLLSQASEKFLAGRLQRQTYLDTEASIKSSIGDLYNNLDNIVSTM